MGRIDNITYPSGRTLNYWYNAEGQISSVTTKKDSGSTSEDVAYYIAWQPFGPLQSMTYGNGLNDWHTFTQDYNIDVLGLYDGGTSIINKSHTRTDDINLTNIWDNVNASEHQSFWHTATNRLQNSSGPWGDLTFYHDGVGNRTYRISEVSGITQTKQFGYGGSDNRVADVTTGGVITRTFTYDAAGNILNDTRSGTPYVYTYNHANRLKTVTVSGNLRSTYIYNAQQQLVSSTLTNMTPSGTTHKIYDLTGNLLAETDGAGNTVREYMWLPQGAVSAQNTVGSARPLAVVSDVNTATPKLYFVHVDHLNRPIMMTDGTKANVWAATWLPFGGAHAITGTAANDNFLLIDNLEEWNPVTSTEMRIAEIFYSCVNFQWTQHMPASRRAR